MQGPALGLSITEDNKKKQPESRATSHENHLKAETSTSQFFAKVRNLLHESNNRSPKKDNLLGKSTDADGIFSKSTLLKTMHAQMETLKKSANKKSREHPYQATTSTGTKHIVSYQSESKIIKPPVAKTSSASRGVKPATVQKVLGRNPVLRLNKERMASHVKSRGFDSNINKTSGEISSFRQEENAITESRVIIKKPNPEYFEIKGKTIDSSTPKSPQNKTLKTKDLSKLLSTINLYGKENANSSSRIHGSILKTKMAPTTASPGQARVRQATSIMYFPLVGSYQYFL